MQSEVSAVNDTSSTDAGSAEEDAPTIPLPDDVLSAVFSKLDVAERARASRVCRRWRAAALQPPHSAALALSVCTKFYDYLEQLNPRLFVQAVAAMLEPAAAGVHVEENSASDGERKRRRLDPELELDMDKAKDLVLRELASRRRGTSTAADNLHFELAWKAAAALALLRGPLCGGLQRLSLDIVVPASDTDAALLSCTTALDMIGAALPPTILQLQLALSVPPSGPGSASHSFWPAVLFALDLGHTAPRLEELEIGLDAHARLNLADLGLSHPSLRRLRVPLLLDRAPLVSAVCNELEGLEGALRHLPRLEAVGPLTVDPSGQALLAPFAAAGVRSEGLTVRGAVFREAHLELLRPGASLHLVRCALPAIQHWSLPAGLAELELSCCFPVPNLLQFLLCRTSKYAPGLKKLSIRHDVLSGVRPHELVVTLDGIPGGTQIELVLQDERIAQRPEWVDPSAIAPLARTLAATPTLHRCLHFSVSPDAISSLRPDIADDFAAYRRARVAALRGMGETGRRLLAEQGYDGDSG